MSALSHLDAHEIARDLGCLVSSRNLSRSSNFVDSGHRMQPPGLFARVLSWFVRGYQRQRTITQLGRLPDYVLEDIGLARGDITRVAIQLSSERSGSTRLVA